VWGFEALFVHLEKLASFGLQDDKRVDHEGNEAGSIARKQEVEP